MQILSYVKINGEVSKRIPLNIEVNNKAELVALKHKLETEEGGNGKYSIGLETRRHPNEKLYFGLEI